MILKMSGEKEQEVETLKEVVDDFKELADRLNSLADRALKADENWLLSLILKMMK